MLTDAQTVKFTELFNGSTKYRDDVGTTHPIKTTITIEGGTSIYLWCGTQEFLTAKTEDEQFNLKNVKLEEYIESLMLTTE